MLYFFYYILYNTRKYKQVIKWQDSLKAAETQKKPR